LYYFLRTVRGDRKNRSFQKKKIKRKSEKQKEKSKKQKELDGITTLSGNLGCDLINNFKKLLKQKFPQRSFFYFHLCHECVCVCVDQKTQWLPDSLKWLQKEKTTIVFNEWGVSNWKIVSYFFNKKRKNKKIEAVVMSAKEEHSLKKLES